MCVCVCERERERETYKLELFLVIQKKKKNAHKYKIIQKLCFLWFTYIGLLIFYTKLTHLIQKNKYNNNNKNLD